MSVGVGVATDDARASVHDGHPRRGDYFSDSSDPAARLITALLAKQRRR